MLALACPAFDLLVFALLALALPILDWLALASLCLNQSDTVLRRLLLPIATKSALTRWLFVTRRRIGRASLDQSLAAQVHHRSPRAIRRMVATHTSNSH